MKGGKIFSRRDLLKLGGLGTASALLAACGPTPAPAATNAPAATSAAATSAPAATPVPTSPPANSELIFWFPNEERGVYIQDQFNAAGLGVTATWQMGEYDDNTMTMAALAAGNPPPVSFLGRWQHPDLAARGAILKLDDYVNASPTFRWENLWGRLQREALFKDRKYVIPYTTDTRALFYNRSVMAEAGLDPQAPPTTWEDLHTMSTQVVQQDSAGRLERIGFTPTFGNPPVFVLFFTLLWCTGQTETNEDRTQITIATPEGQEAMQFIKGLMDDQGGYEAAGAFTRGLTLAEGIDAFSAGKVAFALNLNSVPERYAEFSPELDYGMIAGPAFTKYGIPANYDGGGGWYFFKDGENLDGAYKLVDFVMEQEFMTNLCDRWGTMPARADAGEAWAQRNEAFRRVFINTAETVRWPVVVPYYLELFGPAATMWDNVLIGGGDIAAELQTAQDAMQVVLDKGAELQF